MGEISWIKIATNTFSDEKIRLIKMLPEGDSIVLFWIQLLTLAGQTNDGGYIYLGDKIPYSDEMLATVCYTTNQIARSALSTFQQFKMIEIDDRGFIEIVNWEKYQNIEGMEKVREQTRRRVAKHREKKKQERPEAKCSELNVTLPVTLANGPDEEEDIEEDKDIDLDNTYIHTEEANYLIPISKSEQYPITEDDFLKLEARYPDLDIHNEILLIGKWIQNNSDKNLTLKDMPKFINSWLRRASNFEIDNRNKSRR